MSGNDPQPKPHRRRVRYRGTHPRRFTERYKELDPDRDPDTVAKVIASGRTPAGQHRPILVSEILERLAPEPGQRGADVTFGYGGHSEALLEHLLPAGQLLALDVDGEQLQRSAARLQKLGHGPEVLLTRRSNYAGLGAALAQLGWGDGVDFLLADLGLSSMQIDNPERGFSYKHDGLLDMRMNPERGLSAADWLRRCPEEKLARVLSEGGDEPLSESLAAAIVQAASESELATTRQLRKVIERTVPEHLDEDIRKTTVARVFQAIRIGVNEEFNALDAFLRQLPDCLRPGGRVAILSFHSGEDRRVKRHFREGQRAGFYSDYARDVIRPTAAEARDNTRAAPAKLRWALRSTEP